jgi:hypothetical protein
MSEKQPDPTPEERTAENNTGSAEAQREQDRKIEDGTETPG